MCTEKYSRLFTFIWNNVLNYEQYYLPWVSFQLVPNLTLLMYIERKEELIVSKRYE